ncbi:hypothetical protein [Acinetobacter gyllenbergii]|uniref:hypothetical protein n=1 Tax=Acinetobacter gyllenbergii TaxID=134534 RepID=UPI00080699A7|nr:hypothetical protein [Acinetobacter gyllenbergii]OBY74847.1 hypothetical protein NG55_07860 [Acinetobacter gyllenbergii]
MAKISLIFKKQSTFDSSRLIIVSVVFTLAVLSTYLVRTLIVEHKQQLAEFEKLNKSYDEYLQTQNTARKVPIAESLSIDLFDRIMTAKPPHLFFDRMKISKNSPLQIEGVTSKPLEIDEFIRLVDTQGVKLQISQVQKDSEQQVRFDLRQGL